MIHKHYNIVMLQQLLEVIYYLQKVEVISSLVTTKMLKQGVSSTLGYYRKVGTVARSMFVLRCTGIPATHLLKLI